MKGTAPKIEARLQQHFSPQQLRVIDDSDDHLGHAGAADGKGHFTVEIASTSFDGKKLLASHRLIYDALQELMQTEIHALSIIILPLKHHD